MLWGSVWHGMVLGEMDLNLVYPEHCTVRVVPWLQRSSGRVHGLISTFVSSEIASINNN